MSDNPNSLVDESKPAPGSNTAEAKDEDGVVCLEWEEEEEAVKEEEREAVKEE